MAQGGDLVEMARLVEVERIEVLEIRARRDRNRLLGTYDVRRRVLRLFHRGETVMVELPPEPPPTIDVRQEQE